MESQVDLKKMYAYFTEVNKRIYLIQWEYRDMSQWREIGQNSRFINNVRQSDADNNTSQQAIPAQIPIDNTTQIEAGASTGSQGGTVMPETPMATLPETTTPETTTPENKVFTLTELQQYDGANGKPAYVAVDGVVYDVSTQAKWAGGRHFGVKAGTDASEFYHRCHGLTNVVSKLKKVGVLQK